MEVDRSLLARCLDREPGAWKEFVDRFAGLFSHVIQHSAHARSIRLTPHDMDDLSADVFLALLANNSEILRRFRGESSLSTYLTVICRRIVVHEMIRRRMAEEMGHVKTHGAALERAHVGDADGSTRIENRDLVQRMLDGLADNEAAVVRMFHLEGRTYHEIATGLGVPENSIGPILTRAREKLRKSSLARVSE
ncbi:MAG: sigma-70 family RNA polymerase sigma factor [Planctomycetes bacterium]|nr:sigma-70 family RNA polymerase sigma factor [Planctomycetota bacterium]